MHIVYPGNGKFYDLASGREVSPREVSAAHDLIWGNHEWIGDCYRALLEFDSSTSNYRYKCGDCNIVVPIALFEKAVQTYQEQYHCSLESARETAFMVEMWHADNGKLFYRV